MKYPYEISALLPPHNLSISSSPLSNQGVPVGTTNRLFAAAITSNVRRRHRFRQPECGDCRRRPRRRRRHPQWQLQSPQPVSTCNSRPPHPCCFRVLLLGPCEQEYGSVKDIALLLLLHQYPMPSAFGLRPYRRWKSKEGQIPTAPRSFHLAHFLFRRASKMAVRRSWY